MSWERVYPTGYPLFLFRHTLMPTPIQLGSVMVPSGWVEGIKPPLCLWQGSLFDWVEVFHVKIDDNRSSKKWTQRGAYHFIPPMVLLPWLSSASSHNGHSFHYPMASTGSDVYPSAKCMQCCRHPLPLHIIWSLHLSSVDALVDVHRRSHSFPLIHPREVFLAWCWVIIRPLSSHGIVSLSLPRE